MLIMIFLYLSDQMFQVVLSKIKLSQLKLIKKFNLFLQQLLCLLYRITLTLKLTSTNSGWQQTFEDVQTQLSELRIAKAKWNCLCSFLIIGRLWWIQTPLYQSSLDNHQNVRFRYARLYWLSVVVVHGHHTRYFFSI